MGFRPEVAETVREQQTFLKCLFEQKLRISRDFFPEISRVRNPQKSLGVHKILVCKLWFNPPPRKGPEMRENLYKSV